MKHILRIAVMLIGPAIGNAQSSFSLDFVDTLNSGPSSSVISFSGTCANNDCCNAINLTQSVVVQSLPNGWTMTICNPNGCIAEGDDTFVLGASTTEGVGFEIDAGGNAGTGCAVVRFENAANSSDGSEFTIEATATGATGNPQVTITEQVLSQNYPNQSVGPPPLTLC